MNIFDKYNVIEKSGPDSHVFQRVAFFRVRSGDDNHIRLESHCQVHRHYRHTVDFLFQLPLLRIGEYIPGIRPGKPTSDYLNSILNYIVFVGACGLIIVSIVPIIVSGLFSISRLSFMGTSLIIIVGVVLETIKSIESQMLVRNYKGFLND